MSEHILIKYTEYLKNINILSKLDIVMITRDGNVAADFIKCSNHKFIQKRRNQARREFIDYVLSLSDTDPDFQGTVSPHMIKEYYFHAAVIRLGQDKYILCIGPFYIDEFISSMIEADLPHYRLTDINTALNIFQSIPGESDKRESFSAQKDDSRTVIQKELEIREIHRLNPTSQIRYNAKNEKIIRLAITNGDIEIIKKYNNTFDYMMPDHLLIGEEPLKRAKHGISSGNSVYCRAAEDGGASSVLVRNICAEYAERISKTNDLEQLINLRKEAALIYCRKVREVKQKKYSLYVRHCVNWIEDHLSDNITLSDAAKWCGISYDYLSRLIKQDCGCSFSELVHKSRCQVATYYLQYGMEIWEIAEKCGYKSSSQFCHAFHKLYGMSPGNWQKEHTL